MIKLLVLDIDGCMSDGNITYDENGIENKSFNVKDGLGIVTWIKLGGEVAIITGRDSKIVARRARELGVVHIFQGVKKKKETLANLLHVLGITPQEVAAIGDDLNDLGMLQFVGRSFAPSDAVDAIKAEVDTIVKKEGGRGAVRQMIDTIVQESGKTEEFIKVWQ